MKKNRFYMLGGLMLLAFAGFSFSSFKETLTPYVSYKQAREAERIVQVAGALEKGKLEVRGRRGVPLLHAPGARDA